MFSKRNTEKGHELVAGTLFFCVVVLILIVILALQVNPASPSRQAFESFFQVEVPSFSLSASADKSDGEETFEEVDEPSVVDSEAEAERLFDKASASLEEAENLAPVALEKLFDFEFENIGIEELAAALEDILIEIDDFDSLVEQALEEDRDLYKNRRLDMESDLLNLKEELRKFGFNKKEKRKLRDNIGEYGDKALETVGLGWMK